MTLQKETKKVPITDLKEMDIYDLPYKEFKIIILKKFSKMQENTDRQLKKLGKQCINKIRSLIKNRNHKKKTEILEQKTMTTEKFNREPQQQT